MEKLEQNLEKLLDWTTGRKLSSKLTAVFVTYPTLVVGVLVAIFHNVRNLIFSRKEVA